MTTGNPNSTVSDMQKHGGVCRITVAFDISAESYNIYHAIPFYHPDDPLFEKPETAKNMLRNALDTIRKAEQGHNASDIIMSSVSNVYVVSSAGALTLSLIYLVSIGSAQK